MNPPHLFFSHSVVSDILRPHGLQHTMGSVVCSTLPHSSLKLMSLSWWCHPTISSSVASFSSCSQSFPASGSFPVSRLLAAGSQSIRTSASASVLPVNIQDWFPLGLICLISLLSEGLSRVFTRISSLVLSLLFGFTLASVHDEWKNHSFDYMDLCWQSNVSPF